MSETRKNFQPAAFIPPPVKTPQKGQGAIVFKLVVTEKVYSEITENTLFP